MSESKHTAGPWFISKRYVVGPRDESDTQGFGMIVGVADVYGDNRNQDARLIAAAPDLLDAAKKVLDGLNARIETAPPNAVPVFSGIADLHDAIAKAEGRS